MIFIYPSARTLALSWSRWGPEIPITSCTFPLKLPEEIYFIRPLRALLSKVKTSRLFLLQCSYTSVGMIPPLVDFRQKLRASEEIWDEEFGTRDSDDLYIHFAIESMVQELPTLKYCSAYRLHVWNLRKPCNKIFENGWFRKRATLEQERIDGNREILYVSLLLWKWA